MVDNFLSAGTPGDDEELPSPYGTGPKNRTTEEHRRSDYDNDTWRDRPNGLGLDPSPSLPNAPRSYERGPVPQQPYVPKPPYLPAAPPPPSQQPQQRQYGDHPPSRPYGDQPQSRPQADQPHRPEYYAEREQSAADEPTYGQPAYPEQNPFRPQQTPAQPTPPPSQGRPSPFGPGSNGTSPSRQPQPPAGPPAQQRPPAPPQSSNGVTQRPAAPHSSNGSTNWSSPAPTPSPAPPQTPAQSNGHANGPSNNGVTPQQPSNPAPQPQTPPPAPAQNQAPQPPQPQQPRPAAPATPPPNYPVDTPTITAYVPEAIESYQQEPGQKQDNGYLSDPSAEYESNTPVSEEPKRLGARRRADVQQDAPSQVANEPGASHRAARRAQATASNAPSELGGSPAPGGSPSSAENKPAGGNGPGEGSKRPRRYRVHHLRDMKNHGEKWAMLTAYDQYTAEIFDQAGIPVLLVGDSAANNVFGYDTTLRVTVDELIPLARAVAGAVERALVVADLPFGSYQASPEQAFHTAVRFMKEAGVHAVKLEGGRNIVPMVEKLTQSGIPVMAHIGFTPQSEHSIGGYRVQGRGDQAAGLIDDAVALAEAGAFSVVLEMVPGDVAAEITKRVSIPTIGIGAGRDTDAQVLVWQDMAGLRSGTMPRFVKRYADLRGILTSAATTYAAEVASGTFPADEHTF
ncbi:3-methyl-2-oxobutanoate hydroxymethyltransferase [Kribbella sp. NBC_01484]|uniref:3-methyl-2-oxobutanoate hydroxymethyltransferase n=1 Tax=Kribbella sp. NBC_01484 TaxID=2903579 RepID=UPI002E3632B5|nr:3-methyl-2-oxobutanoate hydroxymethyltransferase [Kribbella sp. NBC_01484]